VFYRTPWLDPIVSLTYASAVTTRVRLGTSILVMPTRHPVLLAKELSTLQALSRDRFILGVGTGWDEREFEAVGMRKSERGARTDEAVELVRRLAGERVSNDGRFARLHDVGSGRR
jgi:alkanesulfonate monooxygenase SsuD/methylene tetrahydromethanopterin reductase-like flavin-dependent oxidoreductase (luciferase family)